MDKNTFEDIVRNQVHKTINENWHSLVEDIEGRLSTFFYDYTGHSILYKELDNLFQSQKEKLIERKTQEKIKSLLDRLQEFSFLFSSTDTNDGNV